MATKKVVHEQQHLIEGFILIGLGLILVLNQGGFLPEDLRSAVSTWIPWLLVVWGLKTVVRV